MTIKLAVSLSKNLSHSNKVLNFDESLNNYAGISVDFYSNKADKEVMYNILNFISKSIKNKYPDIFPWLFIANSTWQPNTRIVKYYGLLNSEFIKKIDLISVASSRYEYILERDGEIKFHDIILLSDNYLKKIVEIFSVNNTASYLTLFKNKLDQEIFCDSEWSGIIYKDIDFINKVIGKNGILIKMLEYGEDKEISFVILGEKNIVESIYFSLLLNQTGDDVLIVKSCLE